MDNSLLFGALAIASTCGLIGFICGGYNEFFKPGGVKELERENFMLRKIISDTQASKNAGALADLSPTIERQRPLSYRVSWTTR
jgi:hypothetical protein